MGLVPRPPPWHDKHGWHNMVDMETWVTVTANLDGLQPDSGATGRFKPVSEVICVYVVYFPAADRSCHSGNVTYKVSAAGDRAVCSLSLWEEAPETRQHGCCAVNSVVSRPISTVSHSWQLLFLMLLVVVYFTRRTSGRGVWRKKRRLQTGYGRVEKRSEPRFCLEKKIKM